MLDFSVIGQVIMLLFTPAGQRVVNITSDLTGAGVGRYNKSAGPKSANYLFSCDNIINLQFAWAAQRNYIFLDQQMLMATPCQPPVNRCGKSTNPTIAPCHTSTMAV